MTQATTTTTDSYLFRYVFEICGGGISYRTSSLEGDIRRNVKDVFVLWKLGVGSVASIFLLCVKSHSITQEIWTRRACT
jgi:hypothetical protein